MRRADRLFQIVQYLRGGRLVTAHMLAERLEVSDRTIYRDIADLQSTGVPIDGSLSVELMLNVFFPNSPLHDMAVVMREDRVVAAGCVLPLANDLPMHQRGLGTRHRAAIVERRL